MFLECGLERNSLEKLLECFTKNKMLYLKVIDLSWNMLDNRSFVMFCDALLTGSCYSLSYISFDSINMFINNNY